MLPLPAEFQERVVAFLCVLQFINVLDNVLLLLLGDPGVHHEGAGHATAQIAVVVRRHQLTRVDVGHALIVVGCAAWGTPATEAIHCVPGEK